MLTCGIVGLPMTGKTTLFSLLTKHIPPEGRTSATAMASVPDPRVDWLSEMYQPHKTVYGQIQVTDIAGLSEGTGKSAAFLDAIRPAQTLVHARAFQGASASLAASTQSDPNIVNHELLLADMALVETRLERIRNSSKNKGPGKPSCRS